MCVCVCVCVCVYSHRNVRHGKRRGGTKLRKNSSPKEHDTAKGPASTTRTRTALIEPTTNEVLCPPSERCHEKVQCLEMVALHCEEGDAA